MSTTVARSARRPRTPAPGARRPFRGVSPEERHAERRKRLLEAGLEAFGTRGFHGVGVRDVCAVAKLTERYFYESFENREALFLAVYESAAERLQEVVQKALRLAPGKLIPQANGVARVGLRAALATFKDDPRLARILLIEVFAVGAGLGGAQHLVSERFAEHIGVITEAIYPDLGKYGLDVRLVANGLYGSTVYVAMRWVLGGFDEPLERILDHCVLFYDTFATEMAQREKTPAKGRALRRSKKR